MTAMQPASVPVVRAALGWAARDVERASTAAVRFDDDDKSVIIPEGEPVALVYADPEHGFELPPGLTLRVDQTAGRVYSIRTTPHTEALTAASARALYHGIVASLTARGWTRDTTKGSSIDDAIASVVRIATAPRSGFGVHDLGVWRVPRPRAPWAALPPGAQIAREEWNGPQAQLTLHPTQDGIAAGPNDVRMVLAVDFDDHQLTGALYDLVDARRLRGGDETLTGWEREPTEDVAIVLRQRAESVAARRAREAAGRQP